MCDQADKKDGHAGLWTPDGWLDDQEEIPRGLYRVENLSADYDDFEDREPKLIGTTREPAKIAKAVLSGKPPNLIGSKVHGVGFGEYHAPLIDLDLPTRYKRSSTPHHHHLLIDSYVAEKQHTELMVAFQNAGITQRGFTNQIERFGQTFVRWNTTKQEE